MVMGFAAAPIVIAAIAMILWLATSMERLVAVAPVTPDDPPLAEGPDAELLDFSTKPHPDAVRNLGG